MTLNRDARDLLAVYGLTPARWIAYAFPRSRRWRGDDCGCPDDRCIGYHHAEVEPCGCLPALLDEYARRRF